MFNNYKNSLIHSGDRDKLIEKCSFKTLSVIMKQIINNF
jgi:hypothetical protein